MSYVNEPVGDDDDDDGGTDQEHYYEEDDDNAYRDGEWQAEATCEFPRHDGPTTTLDFMFPAASACPKIPGC